MICNIPRCFSVSNAGSIEPETAVHPRGDTKMPAPTPQLIRKMKNLTALIAFVLVAPCLPAQAQSESSLADLLPEDSLFYFEIHDIPGLRNGLEQGAMGRIFNDAKVQDFIGGMVGMGMQQWDQGLAMAAEQGMPVQFLDWDAYRSMSMGVAINAGETADQPSVFFGFEMNFADGYGAQAVGMLSGMLQAEGAATVTESEGKATILFNTPPEAPHIEMTLVGDQLRLIGNMNAQTGTSLSQSVRFIRGQKEVRTPGMVCSGFYNPQAALEMQKNFLVLGINEAGPEAEMGVGSIAHAMISFAEEAVGNAEGINFAAGWENGSSVGTAFIDFGGKEAGWAYAADEIDRSLIQYIPHNADSFSLASFGGGEGFTRLMGAVDEMMEQEIMAQPLAIWAEAEPVSHSWIYGENRPLLDKAMQGFGTRAFTYNVPNVGMISAMELKDPAAVQAAATPLVKAVAKALDSIPDLPVAIRAKRESQRSNPGETIPIYYLRVRTDMLPPEMQQLSMFLGAIEPSLAVSPDGWLIFSMQRANVRSVIRSGMTAQDQNILENPEAKDFIDRIPAGTMSAAWSDPRPGVKQGMTMLQGFAGMGQMMLEGQDLPFDLDLTKIPSGDVINAHLGPSETLTWMDETGMRSYSKGSVGFADVLALAGYCVPVGAGAAAYFVAARPEPNFEDFEAPTALVAPSERPTEPVAATHYELARLQTAILLFEMMNDKALPGSLDDLTGTGPEGQYYLDCPEDGICKDGWGNAFVYNLVDGGFTLYSIGPDGVDNGGQGDDITLN